MNNEENTPLATPPKVSIPTWFDIKKIHGSDCLVLKIGQYMDGRVDQYGVDRATITLLSQLIPSLQESLAHARRRTPDAIWADGIPADRGDLEDYVEQSRRLIG